MSTRDAFPLYHIDLYRLTDPSELDGIGFEEYIDSDGATVIEWAERAEDELPAESLSVYLVPCLRERTGARVLSRGSGGTKG